MIIVLVSVQRSSSTASRSPRVTITGGGSACQIDA
jgi:hypothetical protein